MSFDVVGRISFHHSAGVLVATSPDFHTKELRFTRDHALGGIRCEGFGSEKNAQNQKKKHTLPKTNIAPENRPS